MVELKKAADANRVIATFPINGSAFLYWKVFEFGSSERFFKGLELLESHCMNEMKNQQFQSSSALYQKN